MRFILVSILAITLIACTSDKEEAFQHLKAGKKKLYANDVKGALEELNQSIELDPSSSEAFFHRGNAKMNLRDYKGATDDFNACLELNPNYTDAWVNRGNVKFILGDRLGACKDWTKAKELGKENIAERLMNCN